MAYKDIFRILGIYLFGFSLLFLLPLTLAFYYQFFASAEDHFQPHTTYAFFLSLVTSLAASAIFFMIGRNSKGHLFKKEAIVVVVAMWFITPAISALPFLYSHTLSNPLQAYFEAASGLSTTGITILEAKAFNNEGKEIPIEREVRGVIDTKYTYWGTVEPIRDPKTKAILHQGIEAVSKALLFWRGFLNWMGGLGIIVLFVAILPNLGMSGKFLFQSEMTGPWKDPHSPRIGQAAVQLLSLYAGLTLLQFVAFIAIDFNMGWFDAITTAFATVSGGGFSVRNMGVGHYNSAGLDWTIIFFMVLSGTNFAVLYHVLKGKFYKLYQPELLIYLLLLLCGSLLGAWLLVGSEKILLNGVKDGIFSSSEAIRYATFQLVSTQSSVGLNNIDYDSWPYAVQAMMMIAMFIGGMSGSTASGAKVIRLYLLYQVIIHKLKSLFRSDAVRRIKIGSQEVDAGTINTALTYLLVMVLVAAIAVFVYILSGVDPETSFGLVGCMINNVGTAFRAAGPTSSCAFLSNFDLVLSSFLMIMGRLEFLVVLALLMPTFWKQSS